MPCACSVSGPGVSFASLLQFCPSSASCSSHTRASAAPEASGSFTEPVSSLSSRFVPELMLRVPPTSRDYYCWPIRGHERRRPALPLFTFHGTTSFLFLPLQSLLPEVIIPEAEPEASSRSRCHVRRCAAVSQSGALEGEMADWTRGEGIRG